MKPMIRGDGRAEDEPGDIRAEEGPGAVPEDGGGAGPANLAGESPPGATGAGTAPRKRPRHRVRKALFAAFALLAGVFAGLLTAEEIDARGRPADLADAQRLRFDIVASCFDCGGAWESGTDIPGPAWVMADDAELAAYWPNTRYDSYKPWKVKHLELGDPPRIPEGTAAVGVRSFANDPLEYCQVTGVYDQGGHWTVTVARRTDRSDALAFMLGNIIFPVAHSESGILLVRAPPPESVEVRTVDKTKGFGSGWFWWL
jgi:hypothetical protein